MNGTIKIFHSANGSKTLLVYCKDCNEEVLNFFRFLDCWKSKGEIKDDGSILFEISDGFSEFGKSYPFAWICKRNGVNIYFT